MENSTEQNKTIQNWVKQAMIWGGSMFVIMVFLFPWITGDEITWKRILIGIPVWAMGGLVFGLIMKFFGPKRNVGN